MSIANRHLQHTATHWPYIGPDGFGGHEFGTPQVIRCRWVDYTQLMEDSGGKEFSSKATVWVDKDLSPNDYVALGDHRTVPDPTVAGAGVNGIGAEKVRGFKRVTNLRNTSMTRRAFV